MCQDTKKKRETGTIVENRAIAQGIYEMIIHEETIAKEGQPGQFINVYCNHSALLLPRPISICEVDREKGYVKIVYAVVGKGTELMSQYEVGKEVALLGPLGKGYVIDKSPKKHLLVGGGVGTPPLLELAKHLKGEITICLGFRTESYLTKEFQKYGKVYVATEDGSVGEQGNVIDLIMNNNLLPDEIYACGPTPMLKAIQALAQEKKVKGQLSLEERMGCGFGGCVGCVCKIKNQQTEDIELKKVCKDGPVFDIREVVFDA